MRVIALPFLLLLVLATGLLEPIVAAGKTIATELRTEWLPDPIGVDSTAPRLSWRMESNERGQKQTACRVLVASSERMLANNQGDLWDTGKLPGDETLNFVYAGRALASGGHVFWKVRVWDKDGKPSPWSATATWSTGLLKPDDWKAQWISFKDTTTVHKDSGHLFLPAARHYRKEFQTAKTVKRATMYASALGLFELYVNGQRVSDNYFEPGWSDYHKRAYYRTHDVTALVRQGGNAIGAIVADGWYSGYVGYGLLVGYGPNKTGRYFYGKTPALLAQLEIEYADGSREIIGTDKTWKVTDRGPIREADLIMGESYDARAELGDWGKQASRMMTGTAPYEEKRMGALKRFFPTRGELAL